MSVDFEAIAQRGRCDASSLRLALPLLEQGYTPPFLARYRRDELGGADEASLWNLLSAVRNEQSISEQKDRLHAAWKETTLADPAIGHAIKKAASVRVLSRLSRRLKKESSDKISDADRLAVRVLNPQKGDGDDFAAIATKVDGITDAEAAVSGLDEALARRLAGDPRIIASAVRWLAKHAKVKIAKIHDPHLAQEQEAKKAEAKKSKEEKAEAKSPEAKSPEAKSSEASAQTQSATNPEAKTDETAKVDPADGDAGATEDVATAQTPADPATSAAADATESAAVETATVETATVETPAEVTTAEGSAIAEGSLTASTSTTATSSETDTAAQSSAAQSSAEQTPAGSTSSVPTATDSNSAEATATTASQAEKPGKSKPEKKEKPVAKKAKKVSPRQRRRRWLVSVLKPLQGKSFAGDKFSAFQMVMLGRALRSEVAICEFVYDAAKLLAELRRTAGSINRVIEPKLAEIVLQNESAIREAAESSWWDDLQERASTRLVGIAATILRDHINRGSVEAKVVLSIDAVGPRTAASTIVSADGRLLHSEDIPCQMSATQRSATVARLGELIHQHHVDLIVISNGPARRSMIVAIGDLIKQSPDESIHWTLAERGGADVYSSSSIADQEMRSTPRRFRSAAWLAFSVLQPAQAMAKIDPLKLRLSSFQRELSDDALRPVLEDIMVSGASRGGVDVNSAPSSWLRRLPGVTESIATAIDQKRREESFTSRDGLLQLDAWTSEVESRQALPFLRVFNSDETLDGTLIHPSDYAIAKRLAKTLSIELPPASPPGYEPPDFSKKSDQPDPTEVKPIEVVATEEQAKVEDFSASSEESKEFEIESSEPKPADDAATEEAAVEGAAVKDAVPEEGANAESAVADASADKPDADTDTAAESSEPVAEDSSDPAAESSAQDSPPDDASSDSSGDASTDASTEASPPAEAQTVESIKHPLPEKSQIEKCIKEWQIGQKRTNQIVHWLCDPFGDSDTTGKPPGVLSKVPAMDALKEGEQVVGVVVGVMPFGVFVELAPDCSGLIHVSRVSDSYVEDVHEVVQVGDVVTAYVTGIDQKKRRVGLSTLSPEREAELERQKQERSQRGGNRYGRGQGRGQGRGSSQGQRAGGQGTGGQGTGGQGSGGQGSGGPGSGGQRGGNRSGQGAGSNRGDSSRPAGSGGKGGGPRGDKARGNAGRGDAGRGKGKPRRGDGRSRDRQGNRGRGRQPESYRVEAKKEAKPLTDAMKTGEEPLRSFGDLAQLLGSTKKKSPAPQVKPKQKTEAPVSEPTAADAAASIADPSNAAASSADPASANPEPSGSEPSNPDQADRNPQNSDQAGPDQASSDQATSEQTTAEPKPDQAADSSSE